MDDLQELDEESHWSASWSLRQQLGLEAPLDGIDIRRQWRHDIPRIRAEVVDEVKAMIEESAEETAAWMARWKSWVRATYSTPDKPARTQVLVFLELLRLLGCRRSRRT